MTIEIACSLAVISTTAFVALWFWVVKKELHAKQIMIEAAKNQLTASQEQCARVRDGPEEKEAKETLKRTQSVHRQAVRIYNSTLRKPWNAVPGFFLGYRQQKDGNENRLY